MCVFVCGHFNVRLTTPPVLMLWDTQGYLWLPYDLTKVINLFGVTFKQKNIFFQKNTLCHSFRIIVIPSVLLSFLLDYCHSFRIIVIPSEYCHSLKLLPFQIFVIMNSSGTLPYSKGEKIGRQSQTYLRVHLRYFHQFLFFSDLPLGAIHKGCWPFYGGSKLPTFANLRGLGVSGMLTSPVFNLKT